MEDTLNHLKFLNVLSPRGVHIPNCDKKGFYKKKQVSEVLSVFSSSSGSVEGRGETHLTSPKALLAIALTLSLCSASAQDLVPVSGGKTKGCFDLLL